MTTTTKMVVSRPLSFVTLLIVFRILTWIPYFESIPSLPRIVSNLHNKTTIVESKSDSKARPMMGPLRALHRYQSQHSVRALEETTTPQSNHHYHGHRRFAVAYYWCPDRAGNLLHNLFNSVLWSIITNRTLLIQYENSNSHNSFEDCNAILQLAEWIPRWEEWSERLQLPPPVPIPIDKDRWQNDWDLPVVIFPQIPDILPDDRTIVRNTWRNDPHDLHEYQDYMAELDIEHQVMAGMLYQYGVNFVMGMLLRNLFTFQLLPTVPAVLPEPETTPASSSLSRERTFSIALHSRHVVLGDDGSFVDREKTCLDRLLLVVQKNRTIDCHVYLMSDRPLTLQLLSDHVRIRHNCTPHTTTVHELSTQSRLTEHGPWSGTGFLQDLYTTALARDGYVGDPTRSSTMLLVELMTYDRVMEWDSSTVEPVPLQRCRLPMKLSEGYDYGPGTPTFRHHSLQEPLVPVQRLASYRRQAWDTNTSSPNPYGCVVVEYNCRIPLLDRIAQVSNGLFLAMLTNRSLLVEPVGPCEDADKPWLQPWLVVETNSTPRMDQVAVETVSNVSALWNHKAVNVRIPTIFVGFDDISVMASFPDSTLASDLYSQGTEFLYGMLLDAVLDLKNVTGGPEGLELTAGSKTVAVWGDDCSSSCLDRVLVDAKACQALVASDVSDNSPVLERLRYHNCSVWKNSPPTTAEKTQILQDLVFLSKARHAVLGSNVDSSSLLRARIEYHRRMEIWKLGRDPPIIPVVHSCA